jgi:hypothetical protein
LVLIGVFTFFSSTPAQVDQGIFKEVSAPAGADVAQPAWVVRQRWTTIDYALVRETLPRAFGGTDAVITLPLNLFPDAQFTAVRDRVETTSTGYVWIGRLQGVEQSTVTFAVSANVMSASITTPVAAFVVRYVAAGVHVVQQINREALPPEAPPIAVDGGAPANNDVYVNGDDGSQIDLLVVYTPAARAAQGGTAGIETLIDLGVSETNIAYADSGVIHRIRLVNKQEIAYTEVGISTDLSRLRSTSDGFMDSVHTLRDTYGADIVQLIENEPSACGIAYLMTTVSSSFATSGFGITHYSCVSPNYSFEHEMGHNMGSRHDTYVDPGTTPYTFSHGYVNQAAFVAGAPTSKRWRDIMAYNDQCTASGFSCTRLRYFSNPSNTYLTDPMGNATTANAVLTLNNTRMTVANFRASIKKRHGQIISQ